MNAFTLFHVFLSIIGIATGLVVMAGLLSGKVMRAWTAIFLATTVATSVTGFFFPFHKLLPAHIVGIISLVVLTIAIVARYAFNLRGAWRWMYVVTVATALYLNVFVGVVQAFEKIPSLRALAPKQSEPPFLITQLAVLILFITVGVFATTRFHIAVPREG